MMKLQKLDYDFTVCKVASIKDIDLNHDFFFLSKTDEEISLVCLTKDVPCTVDDESIVPACNLIAREDGWKAFRIQGVLDFSLIGILSRITSILAENKIGIFAVSTFNTDYILVKREQYGLALSVLADNGYEIDSSDNI